MCGAKYTPRPRASPVFYRDTCVPKLFDAAFADFKRLFEKKTGRSWDARCDGKRNGKGEEEEYFRYSVPDGGKPVGVLPLRWGVAAEEGEGETRGETGEDSEDSADADGEVSEHEHEKEQEQQRNSHCGLKSMTFRPVLRMAMAS